MQPAAAASINNGDRAPVEGNILCVREGATTKYQSFDGERSGKRAERAQLVLKGLAKHLGVAGRCLLMGAAGIWAQ
jgi:hypothetical protein